MESLESIRARIDEVDESIVKLIEQRAELVQSLISVKANQGLSVRIPEREEAIIQQLHDRHGKHFSREELDAIYRPIFDACVRLQLAL